MPLVGLDCAQPPDHRGALGWPKRMPQRFTNWPTSFGVFPAERIRQIESQANEEKCAGHDDIRKLKQSVFRKSKAPQPRGFFIAG